MKVLYRVQHSLGRDEALARLLANLPPALVITDHLTDDPDPMRCQLRCLSDLPDDATHVCVLQDDAVVCADFESRLTLAVEEKPGSLISLFVGGLPGKTRKDFWAAQKSGRSWSLVYRQGIVHVVGLVWPVALARDFVAWFPTAEIPAARKPYRSDDMVVGYWAKINRHEVWATVPCLVEHPDDLPSVAQLRRGGTGLDKGRRAISFVD